MVVGGGGLRRFKLSVGVISCERAREGLGDGGDDGKAAFGA